MSGTLDMDDDIRDDLSGDGDAQEPPSLDQPSADDPGRSPGAMLRQARLDNDYSIDELCSQTMLSRKTVEALENDWFEQLPQPVFARGYYRKCAKLLDMDAERLVTAFDAAGGAHVTAVPVGSTSVKVVPADVTPDHRRSFKSVFLILVVIVIAVAGYLFWTENMDLAGGSDGDTNIDLASRVGESEADAGLSQQILLSGSSADSSADDTATRETPSSADTGDTLGAVSMAGQQSDASTDAAAASDASASDDATATDAVTLPADAGTSATAAASGAADTTAADAAAASGAAAGTALTLNFTDPSWVDVRDATGEQLLVGIYESTTRTVDGQPPYKLVLGFAPGVSIEYAGEAVDFDIGSGSTARFSVGAEAD